MTIDFFARQTHYADHMAPIYEKMGDAVGSFFVSPLIEEYAQKKGINPTVLKPNLKCNPMDVAPPVGRNPILVAGVADLQMVYLGEQQHRRIILMEHGPGITFPNNQSYAGNMGYRKKASLTLAPNYLVHEKTKKVLPELTQVIIGTPMLDKWANRTRGSLPKVPTVAIAFHWDGSAVAPEAGNAFRYYESILPSLAKQSSFKLIAHGHPKNLDELKRTYERLGIEVVRDFEEVMERANLLINDCSSILYMFLVTGWPVIILNAPHFRRNVNFGLRFWEYTNVGEQVERPNELLPAIERTFSNLDARKMERRDTIDALFPFLGRSAELAAQLLKDKFCS
jgi:hypothetical protein